MDDLNFYIPHYQKLEIEPLYIILMIFIFFIMVKISNYIFTETEIQKLHWYNLLSINLKSNNKFFNVITLNSPDYRENLYCLNDMNFYRTRTYDIVYIINKKKIKKNIFGLNYANKCIIKKILKRNENNFVIVQKMCKPRDYFEYYASFIVNNCNVNIEIYSTPYWKRFPLELFKLENVLKGGTHIFFNKKNRELDLKILSKKYVNKIIYYGIFLHDMPQKMENIEFTFFKKIENKYFEIDLYNFENKYESYFRVKYGVSIKENNLNLDIKTLFYIGQLYLE